MPCLAILKALVKGSERLNPERLR